MTAYLPPVPQGFHPRFFKKPRATMTHATRRTCIGFTLIELLVVISIVALLLAIMLPAVGRARESARRAICLGNQRQYGISLYVYTNDGNGYFPGIIRYGSNVNGDGGYSGGGYQWMKDSNRAVTQYIPKPITICPSSNPKYNTNKNTWDVDPSDPTVFSGETDFSLKVGFGSNHVAVNPDGYPDPAAANLNSFRGMYNWRFKRKQNGFGFNYRVEQRNFYDPYTPQSNKAILLMDRQRPPIDYPTDTYDSGKYAMTQSNHAQPNDPWGAAEGVNALIRDGSARWMYLVPIYAQALPIEYAPNNYDMYGHAEGRYEQFVDNEMAALWQ